MQTPSSRAHILSEHSVPGKRNLWRIAPAVLLFCIAFALGTAADWQAIATRDLYFWDETVNATVSANLTRLPFPPKVRINSLIERRGHWMEGPYWQHIPPMFAYVPLPLFALDGRVTIEMKRLSYALVLLFTGICFIVSVGWFERSMLANLCAALAAVLWLQMPYPRQVVLGWVFGSSDIVLAATVILCMAALLSYLNRPPSARVTISTIILGLYGAVMALPIVAKSALGLIPSVTFFALLLWDRKKIDRKYAIAFISFLVVILCAYAPLYFSSPETFRQEIGFPLAHFGNVEGWAYPWHYFLTHYLPKSYFLAYTPLVYTTFVFSLALVLSRRIPHRSQVLMALCGGWFLWNLVAVSAVTSKSPNFIFQSSLPLLFFCLYGPLLALQLFCRRWLPTPPNNTITTALKFTVPVLVLLALASFTRLYRTIHRARTAPYAYKSLHEQFYQLAEAEQASGANTSDLFIVNGSREDCWFRYPIIFLTGAEARTLDEMVLYNIGTKEIQAKYRRVNLVIPVAEDPPPISATTTTKPINAYKVVSFDAKTLHPDYASVLKQWLAGSPQVPSTGSSTKCVWEPFLSIDAHPSPPPQTF